MSFFLTPSLYLSLFVSFSPFVSYIRGTSLRRQLNVISVGTGKASAPRLLALAPMKNDRQDEWSSTVCPLLSLPWGNVRKQMTSWLYIYYMVDGEPERLRRPRLRGVRWPRWMRRFRARKAETREGKKRTRRTKVSLSQRFFPMKRCAVASEENKGTPAQQRPGWDYFADFTCYGSGYSSVAFRSPHILQKQAVFQDSNFTFLVKLSDFLILTNESQVSSSMCNETYCFLRS